MKHAAIDASPALAFQAVTAFALDAGADAVALVRKHPNRQTGGKTEQWIPHGARSSPDGSRQASVRRGLASIRSSSYL